jgi:hypothetical protein
MTLPDPSANTADAPDLPCPFCGYNLHGIASERCPECGKAIDYPSLSSTRIAWENRRRIGRVRAYLRTAAGFTFWPGVLARTGALPDYRDAVRFRRITVVLAWMTALLPALVWRISTKGPEDSRRNFGLLGGENPGEFAIEFLRAPASLAITLAGVLLALIAISGAATYFCRPASLSISRQNRAVALMQYASAPLAWLPLTVGFLAVTIWFHEWLHSMEMHWGGSTGLIVIGVIVLMVQMFLWWTGTLRVLWISTQASFGRMVACGAVTPVTCLLLFVGVPVVLNVVISFLAVVLLSLFGH